MSIAVVRKPLRADAARNVDKIILAARQCFREHGPDVPLQTIAATAGVGPATLFRNFADKEELLAAIAAECLERFAAAINDALAAEPGNSLARFRATGIAIVSDRSRAPGPANRSTAVARRRSSPTSPISATTTASPRPVHGWRRTPPIT